MQDKKSLRKKNREIRARLNKTGALSRISKSIVEKIKCSDYFLSAKHVLIFHPKNGEIDLLELLGVGGKQFYLPRCNGNSLEICPHCTDDELCENKFGIKEPVCASIEDLTVLDIIFVPALGADPKGNRIGYGGGFYDRFLSENKALCAKKVVAIPSDLICENIECEPHDVCYDELVTD